MNPLTEDDIANYLANTPDFFLRHAELLASVQLNSPHGNRAVSLQERQAEMLRDKIKALELRIMEMIRNGADNVVIADKLQRWARQLLEVRASRTLPQTIAGEIRAQFMVPQVALKVWDVDARYVDEPFAQGVSEDARSFATSLTQPYCGVNSGFEAVGWLEEPGAAMSLALIPLRKGPVNGATAAFGMLVLASPDAQRFSSGMGTDFLERIAELASAALTRLREE
ncbi:MAG TPA: DUF484 family protein [Ramlibacter sp.]|nr:DUF484 family protein [Ramlibacter sp.]